MEILNSKSQISNIKQITKIQNPKLLGILLVLVIGYWNLKFI